MLPKSYRLTSRNEFQSIYKKGKFFSIDGVTVSYLCNNSDKISIGFVISKKFSKKAVVRNTEKRRLREAVRTFLPQLKKGYNIIISRNKNNPLELEDLRNTLSLIFKKSNLL